MSNSDGVKHTVTISPGSSFDVVPVGDDAKYVEAKRHGTSNMLADTSFISGGKLQSGASDRNHTNHTAKSNLFLPASHLDSNDPMLETDLFEFTEQDWLSFDKAVESRKRKKLEAQLQSVQMEVRSEVRILTDQNKMLLDENRKLKREIMDEKERQSVMKKKKEAERASELKWRWQFSRNNINYPNPWNKKWRKHYNSKHPSNCNPWFWNKEWKQHFIQTHPEQEYPWPWDDDTNRKVGQVIFPYRWYK